MTMQISKKERNGIFFLISVGVAIFIYGYLEKRQINVNGLYTIAVRSDYHPGVSRGGVSYYKYYYKNETYSYGIRDGGQTDSFVFVHFLPDDPKVCRIVSKYTVGDSCSNLDKSPAEGWKTIPKNCIKWEK